MTRLVYFEAGESPAEVSEEALGQLFSASCGCTLASLGQFCALYGHKVRAVLLPEITSTEIRDNTPIWTVPYQANGRLTIISGTISDLKTAIKKESGGPITVGQKGLNYGTSSVECILSRTDAAYPGDVDAVLCDGDGCVRCVLEYKKHNLSCPIRDNLIHRYYPHPDGRKYQRLDALVRHYRNHRENIPDVPFVVLYYSTKFRAIRMQIIRELTPTTVVVAKDSGDWDITNMPDEQVASIVVKWLGFSH